jgi:hypothetical protein
MATAVDDKQLIKELKKVGITAKRWINSGTYAPPADVNYRGELRVHTGGTSQLIDTNEHFHQAIIRPTSGRYRGEDFLVGMDETSNFVCRLPVLVESVDRAHEILRPMGVMPHTIRQGEWFFVPAVKCACGAELGVGNHKGGQRTRLGGTTHVAALAVNHMDRMYAMGRIEDDRSGRHAPVDLGEKWHEAFHNTEKQLDREPQRPRPRMFD